MTIRPATNRTAGVKIFYVTGDSGAEYVVQFIRRAGMNRAQCSCPQFLYRGSVKGSHRYCKHIRAARALKASQSAEPITNLTAQLKASIKHVQFRNTEKGK